MVWSMTGCTFEHRGNGAGEADPDLPAVISDTTAGEPTPPRSPEVPVLEALRTHREAVGRGDLALALALLHREATLADALLATVDEELTRGELLLELRSRLGAGYHLVEVSVEASVHDESALVVSRLLLEGHEGAAGALEEMKGRGLRETAFLLLTPEGWRIRHLHRSVEGAR